MKQYYISDFMFYCYPYETEKIVTDFGVLKEYINKTFDRDVIDKITCELITKHPHIAGSMYLELRVMWEEKGNGSGVHQNLRFRNYDYKNQNRGCPAIIYEK